jgi:hypothetical protein
MQGAAQDAEMILVDTSVWVLIPPDKTGGVVAAFRKIAQERFSWQ